MDRIDSFVAGGCYKDEVNEMQGGFNNGRSCTDFNEPAEQSILEKVASFGLKAILSFFSKK